MLAKIFREYALNYFRFSINSPVVNLWENDIMCYGQRYADANCNLSRKIIINNIIRMIFSDLYGVNPLAARFVNTALIAVNQTFFQKPHTSAPKVSYKQIETSLVVLFGLFSCFCTLSNRCMIGKCDCRWI